jgi:hypothetical protein
MVLLSGQSFSPLEEPFLRIEDMGGLMERQNVSSMNQHWKTLFYCSVGFAIRFTESIIVSHLRGALGELFFKLVNFNYTFAGEKHFQCSLCQAMF